MNFTAIFVSSAVVCVEGTYQSEDNCISCPIGTYQNSVGSTTCETCPLGTSTLGAGATLPEQCIGE